VASLGALAVVVASLIAGGVAGTAAVVVAFSRPARPVPPLTLGHGWAATLPDEGSVVAPVVFSPDGRDLAMADDLVGVMLKSVPGGRTVLRLPLSDTASALAFSPDGTLLAIGVDGPGDEVYVEVRDTATGRRVLRFRDPRANLSVDAVAFSPDGSVLAVGDDMGFASLWDARTGRRLAELRDRRVSEVGSLAFSPDGRMLASAGYDGVVDIWDTATGKTTATTRLPGLASNAEQRSAGVTVIFSPGGRTLTIGDGGSGVYRWDLATGRRARVMTWAGCPGEAWDVTFSPGAGLAATLGTGPHSGRVCVWNVGTGALVATITDPAGYSAASVAFRPDGKELAFGDDDGGPDAGPPYPASAYVWKLG
jgi:WD40 repeat protein